MLLRLVSRTRIQNEPLRNFTFRILAFGKEDKRLKKKVEEIFSAFRAGPFNHVGI